jgi:hypothetical protein
MSVSQLLFIVILKYERYKSDAKQRPSNEYIAQDGV